MEKDALSVTVAVMVGFGTALSVYPRGGVTLGSVVLAAMAPVVLSATWRLRRARTCLCLLALWWLATLVTELAVHDTFRHVIFALCRPLTVALSFCGAVWALRLSSKAARAYVTSVTLGLTAAVALYPSTNLAADPWKYGYGPVVTLAVMLVSAALLRGGRRLSAGVLVIAVAMVSLLLGFRSEFLVSALAGTIAVLASAVGPDRGRKRYLLTGGLLCALLVAIYAGYGELASGGKLGRQQQTRWEQQSGIEGGLLIGARPESFASATTIADFSPIGRGVSPDVDDETRSAFLQRLRELGFKANEANHYYYFDRDGLYLHSVLFQTWAEAGFLVVPGLLYPLLIVLRALLLAFRRRSAPASLVFCLLFVQLSWDTLFSPWPRLQAIYLGTATAAAVVYLSSAGAATAKPAGTPSAKRFTVKEAMS